ncbi:putative abieta-7,13-dien-18-ol hydroxylase [Helianthus anomalus]
MSARNNIIRKINKIICYTRLGDGDPGYDGGLVRRLVVEGSLPDEAIADFIINLLFAGNETTAKTMLFAIYFLTHSPVAANQLLVSFNKLNYWFGIFQLKKKSFNISDPEIAFYNGFGPTH